MARVKQVTEDTGATRVVTYLNSGNVVFSSTRPAAELEVLLTDVFTAQFGFSIPTIVVPLSEVESVVSSVPFRRTDPLQIVVCFVRGTPREGLDDRIRALASPGEKWIVADTVTYIDFAHGQARSKLALSLASVFAPAYVTTRTVRTMSGVAAIDAQKSTGR